jgi:hypothetical protein
MYLVFDVFYFFSGVGQKDSGVGRARLPPPFATPLTPLHKENKAFMKSYGKLLRV